MTTTVDKLMQACAAGAERRRPDPARLAELCSATGPMTGADFATLRASIGEQEAVAAAMESDRTTLARWENNRRAVPGPARVLIRILARENEAERVAEAKQVAATKKAQSRGK